MDDVLVWEAPARCPAEEKVRAEIAALVRPVGQRPRYEIAARITEQAGRFTLRLTIVIDDVAGERTLTETSCETLTSAGTAIVALAVNAATEARASAASAPRTPPPATTAQLALLPTEPSIAEAPASAEPRVPRKVFGGAWGAVELGTLPHAQPLVGVLIGYERAPFALHAYGGLGPAQRVVSSNVSGASADVSTAVVGFGAFRGLFDLPLGPTAGLSLARFSGRGAGPTITPREVDYLMVRAEAGALAAYERGFIGARLAVLATVPLVRPTFILGDDATLFRPSRIGGRAEIGVFARF